MAKSVVSSVDVRNCDPMTVDMDDLVAYFSTALMDVESMAREMRTVVLDSGGEDIQLAFEQMAELRMTYAKCEMFLTRIYDRGR